MSLSRIMASSAKDDLCSRDDANIMVCYWHGRDCRINDLPRTLRMHSAISCRACLRAGLLRLTRLSTLSVTAFD